MKRVLVLLMVAALFQTGCREPNRVPEYYFLLLPFLLAGGQRPETPANLRSSYQPVLESILLEWDTARDLDTGLPVGLYRVYLFVDEPPMDASEGSRERNRLDEISEPFYLYDIGDPFSGTLWFTVTAYDGFIESYPTDAEGFRFSLE